MGDANGFTAAPGETGVVTDSFSPSPVMFWLKTKIDASSTRVRYVSPNTLLGLIPLGEQAKTIPVANISSVDTDTRFNMGPFLIGLVLTGVGLGCLPDNLLLGLILLAFAVANLVNALSARLTFVNHAGGRNTLTVSILEKTRLMQLAERIEQLVFADRAATRHAEAMDIAQRQYTTAVQQTILQQQMLDAQQHDHQHTPAE